MLHERVGLDDVVEAVGVGEGHDGAAGGDVVEEALQDVGGQVGRAAAVGGEPDTARQVRVLAGPSRPVAPGSWLVAATS